MMENGFAVRASHWTKSSIVAGCLALALLPGHLQAQGHLSTADARAWPERLGVILERLDQPIAIYLGGDLGPAPRMHFTSLTGDLQLIALAANLKGRYVRDVNFHVVAPDLDAANPPLRSAKALVEFVDSLTTEQFEALFTTGIEVRDLTMDQLIRCLPLLRSEEQLDSVLNSEYQALITVRPSLSVEPAKADDASPQTRFHRYIIDPSLLHIQSVLLLAEGETDIPTRSEEWTPVKLVPVTPSRSGVMFTRHLNSLGGFLAILGTELGINPRIDPRLLHHHIYVHGRIDRDTAVRLISLLADVEKPQFEANDNLKRRVDEFHEIAFRHWNSVSHLSKVQLTDEELELFFNETTLYAHELDGGTGRFAEFFETALIGPDEQVRLLFELDWHISSVGSYDARDASGRYLTAPNGSRYMISNKFNQLVKRSAVSR